MSPHTHITTHPVLQPQGDDSGVTGITVQEKGSSSEEQIDAEGVFIYVAGSKPITDFCEGKVCVCVCVCVVCV